MRLKLLLDLGNTRLKIAALESGAVGTMAAFAHGSEDFDAQLTTWLADLPVSSDAEAWIAAVAPDDVVVRVATALRARGIGWHRVQPQAQALGVQIAYAEPERLGVDRWLMLLAAHALVREPVLVVGVGTALTLDGLLPDGRHLGGLITAAPDTTRAALVARAPRLQVGAGRVLRFAATTEDAIASGCILGAVALIERSLVELTRDAGHPARLLLSGGGAAALRDWLPPHEIRPQLVLEGLARRVQPPDAADANGASR